MTDTEKEKPKCPVCQTDLVPVYPDYDPHILYDEQRDTYKVQMRCPKCVINIMLSVKATDLQQGDPRE